MAMEGKHCHEHGNGHPAKDDESFAFERHDASRDGVRTIRAQPATRRRQELRCISNDQETAGGARDAAGCQTKRPLGA